MKLEKKGESMFLTVDTTDKQDITQQVPKENIHYWYPFNINFHYKYSKAEGYLYLVKDAMYEGDNHYKADILKRTKKLNKRDGVMFHPHIYRRNRYIMSKARTIGVVTLIDDFTSKDVTLGYQKLRDITNAVIEGRVEKRILESMGEDIQYNEEYEGDWVDLVYNSLTPKEEETLLEVGEMYVMLSVMRKLLGK